MVNSFDLAVSCVPCPYSLSMAVLTFYILRLNAFFLLFFEDATALFLIETAVHA